MYFLLILFFGSLFGITFMIGKKLLMLQNGEVLNREEVFLKTPYLEEWKQVTIKNIKKHSHTVLVTTIRFYVRSTNLLKNKYQKIKSRVKDMNRKKLDEGERKEVSKFLKMISEYKQKIRKIKYKINEEEKKL